MILYILFLTISILTENPLLSQANISIEVRNMRTGVVVDAYRPDKVVPPASVMKLMTTACALQVLGDDFRFETRLTHNAKLDEQGVLHGNLYIEGGCDPSLGSRQMKGQNFLPQWVRALRNAGIRRIDGAVVADMTMLDGDAVNPAWLYEDMGNYYAPGIFGLNYLDNTTNIVLRSGPVGSLAEVIRTDPVIPEMTYNNHIRCTSITYDGAYVHGLPYSHERYLTGSVPSNQGTFGVRGDMANPGLLLAQHLTKALREAGIAVTHEATYLSEAPAVLPARQTLYTHQSDSLGALIAETNQNSNNLYAEAIYRYLGTRYRIPGTIVQSRDLIRDFWARRGVHIRGALIQDGCGLAPQDAVSAETWVQILRYMASSSQHDVWMASLPTTGQSGTLKWVGRETPLEGNIHAKTGTIAGTKNLAGYMTTASGDTLVFAILVNSASCKARRIQTIINQYLLDLYLNN